MILRLFFLFLLFNYPLQAEVTSDIHKIEITQIIANDLQEIIISANEKLTIGSIEYQVAEKEIVFKTKEQFIVNMEPDFNGLYLQPAKSLFAVKYNNDELPQFSVKQNDKDIIIKLNQDVFLPKPKPVEIVAVNDETTSAGKSNSNDPASAGQSQKAIELRQVLFVEEPGSGSNDIVRKYLLLNTTNKVDYSLIQTDVNSYQLKSDQFSLAGKFLELPYLAPNNFPGIQSVKIEDRTQEVVVNIIMDMGYNLSSNSDINGIRIIPEKIRY